MCKTRPCCMVHFTSFLLLLHLQCSVAFVFCIQLQMSARIYLKKTEVNLRPLTSPYSLSSNTADRNNLFYLSSISLSVFFFSIPFSHLNKEMSHLHKSIISMRSSQVPHSFSSMLVSWGQNWAFQSLKREHMWNMCWRVLGSSWHVHR
ncbi:hypothetical protein BsWGS_19671 [Bradybaena similaris]